MGLEGKTLDEAREPATSVGTVVHDMVEAFLHGDAIEEPKTLEAVTGFESFRDWWEASGLTVEVTELAIVSDSMRFGGTLDAILVDAKGRKCLGDWKTSNGIYPDYLCQIAAYGLLWEEYAGEKLEGGFHLARFSKEHGDFEHRHYFDLSDAADLFLGGNVAQFDQTKALAIDTMRETDCFALMCLLPRPGSQPGSRPTRMLVGMPDRIDRRRFLEWARCAPPAIGCSSSRSTTTASPSRRC
jgi:hypothetical protein